MDVVGIFDHPGTGRDPSLSSFYGLMDHYGHVLSDPKDSVNPKVDWEAPINDHLYSPCYKFVLGNNDGDARN